MITLFQLTQYFFTRKKKEINTPDSYWELSDREAELSELMEADEEYGDGKSSKSMELRELRSLMDSSESEFQLELEDSAE